MKRNVLSLLLLLTATLSVTAQISPEMQEHIRQAEGCSLTVYMDGGYLAVGYGHRLRDDDVEWLRDLELYDEITQEAAELIFRLDMSRLVADGLREVRREIGNDFPQGVYDVMGSLIYNMGLDGLRSTRFWQLFREGRYVEARDRLLVTRCTIPGLRERRIHEAVVLTRALRLTGRSSVQAAAQPE